MSYSRFSNADLYVYMDINGSLACCGCWLDNEWYFDSTEAMIAHIAEHRAAGHDVPAHLEASLRADDEDNFPPQCADGHAWGDPFYPYADSPHEHVRALTRRKCTRCHWEDG